MNRREMLAAIACTVGLMPRPVARSTQPRMATLSPSGLLTINQVREMRAAFDEANNGCSRASVVILRPGMEFIPIVA
jgi:hypothetical protein